jgi:spore germination cell wall hydrolase CwlJ-like protein
MITDMDLLALCIYQEAGREIDDGKAAIARVIKNRIRLKFFSDGTLRDTIMRPSQFSWINFEMIKGKYTRVCTTMDQSVARVEELFNKTAAKYLADCRQIGYEVMGGTYRGPLYDRLTDEATNYINPDIAEPQPWAVPEKLVCVIGRHEFFHR